jgi:hypothetical protein
MSASVVAPFVYNFLVDGGFSETAESLMKEAALVLLPFFGLLTLQTKKLVKKARKQGDLISIFEKYQDEEKR